MLPGIWAQKKPANPQERARAIGSANGLGGREGVVGSWGEALCGRVGVRPLVQKKRRCSPVGKQRLWVALVRLLSYFVSSFV